MNLKFRKTILNVLFIVAFFCILKIILDKNSQEDFVNTMPITFISKDCINKELSQVTWAEGQNYEFINYSDKLVSRPDLIGYLKIYSSNQKNHDRVGPILNMIMSKCFPEVVYEAKFSYPFEAKLADDLNFFVQSEKMPMNKLNVELDLHSKNLRAFLE